MDIQTRKIEFLKEFLKIQDEDLIALLEDVMLNEVSPMSEIELNERIDKSMEDSKNGRLTSTLELNEEIEKWK